MSTALEAGRELDALVAERVMGWTLYSGNRNYRQGGEPVPAYSTDIAAAWAVVEKMEREHGSMVVLTRLWVTEPSWQVELLHGDFHSAVGEGETPALAICRAALDAVEVSA